MRDNLRYPTITCEIKTKRNLQNNEFLIEIHTLSLITLCGFSVHYYKMKIYLINWSVICKSSCDTNMFKIQQPLGFDFFDKCFGDTWLQVNVFLPNSKCSRKRSHPRICMKVEILTGLDNRHYWILFLTLFCYNILNKFPCHHQTFKLQNFVF